LKLPRKPSRRFWRWWKTNDRTGVFAARARRRNFQE
jgi:hypothetical protein